MQTPLRFGIVGAGFIAGAIADAIGGSRRGELAAVASRRLESARAFADRHGIPEVFGSWQEMVASDTVDAVYVATPTAVREEISVAAAAAGKHVLADKPFAGLESLRRITGACTANGVAFMDATHFVHHPRTQALQETLVEQVGEPLALRSAFFFPLGDRDNIRFDTAKEPAGAVGDMGWYSMRAIVEYMPANLDIATLAGHGEKHAETGALVRGAGFIAFENGNTSTFDFGYSVGSIVMDLDILGPRGMVRLDDFVLDWGSSISFQNPGHRVGYLRRQDMATPDRFEFVETPSDRPQAVRMIDTFTALVADPASPEALRHRRASEHTQRLVDALWQGLR